MILSISAETHHCTFRFNPSVGGNLLKGRVWTRDQAMEHIKSLAWEQMLKMRTSPQCFENLGEFRAQIKNMGVLVKCACGESVDCQQVANSVEGCTAEAPLCGDVNVCGNDLSHYQNVLPENEEMCEPCERELRAHDHNIDNDPVCKAQKQMDRDEVYLKMLGIAG